MSTAQQIFDEVERARELSFDIQKVLSAHRISIADYPKLLTDLITLVNERRETDKQ